MKKDAYMLLDDDILAVSLELYWNFNGREQRDLEAFWSKRTIFLWLN
jgi:hypothetical protein